MVLSCLEVTLLESVCLCVVLFSTIIIYFLLSTFSALPSFSPPSRTQWLNVRSFVIVPQITEAPFIFIFQSIFSLLFRVGNFNQSIFQVTGYFMCPAPFCCWAHLLSFYFNYCIFASKISNWFFFMSSIFLLKLSFSFFF